MHCYKINMRGNTLCEDSCRLKYFRGAEKIKKKQSKVKETKKARKRKIERKNCPKSKEKGVEKRRK